MHQFFVPGIISELHVISNAIGKAQFLFRIFFSQSFIDDHFQVLTQVRKLGVTLGLRKGIGFGFQGFPGWDGVGGFDIQAKISDQKQMIPELMPEILHIFQMRV